MTGAFTTDDIIETVLALPTAGGVFEVSKDDVFTLVAINAAALELIQARSASPEGLQISEIQFSANAASSLQAMAERCCESWQTEVFEETYVLRDGSTVHLSLTWVPIIDRGRPQVLVLTATDVTRLVDLRMRKARELTLFASGFLQTCAWCGSVESDGDWLPASEYVAAHGPAPSGAICPECSDNDPSTGSQSS